MSYERANIQRMTPYAPGEQIQTQRIIKLNTNENPYLPSEPVMQAIRDVSGDSLRRYPPPLADGFRQAAARLHGISPDQVIATNGGDELLRMVMTVFCQPVSSQAKTGGLVMAEPSYSLYPVLAEIHDTPLTRIPLADDFSVTSDFADRALDAQARLAILVNPHAPSGRLETLETMRRIAERLAQGRCVLLVDEAYTNFASWDCLPLIQGPDVLDNVLLLRTMSKGYSLAGLRFGYGMGSPALITALHKARDSYNVDALAQAAATASLTHWQLAAQTWQKVIAERTRLTQLLRQRGWIVPDSQSNFILTTPAKRWPDAATIYQSLKAQGILVRYFDQDRLRDKLRISIGTPEQDDTMLQAIDVMAQP